MTNAAQFALTHGTKVAGFGSGCARESHALLFGDQEMTERGQIQVPQNEADVYTSRENFHTIFNEDLKQLYQLSFLLTRDTAKAERCLVAGLEGCVKGNPVFREWARSWAKRLIVQNAIREMKPRRIHSNIRLSDSSFSDIDQLSSAPDRHFALEAVLNLEDFERFVFIISVLEHYSDHDCALLLGCSVREILEARARTLRELIESSQGISSRNQPLVQEKK
jgi:DNA-directed RNA polymerase specialized sigma24 family protein